MRPAKADKRKRKAQPQDEIDAVFDATLGKKVKKAELATGVDTANAHSKPKEKQRGEKEKKSKRKRHQEDEGAYDGLADVLGAIRSAPKEDNVSKKRKKTH